MLDNRDLVERTLGINFIEDFVLAENQNIFFFIDVNQGDVLHAPITYVYAKEDSQLFQYTCLSDMLININRKSEVCEYVGYDAYVVGLKEAIVGQAKVSVTIPLLINDVAMWTNIRMRFDGQKNMYFGRIRNEEMALNEKLYEVSYKDALTGLFNRNTLMHHLATLRNDISIYGVMIDIDEFKKINDTYGHEKGDDVLRQFGQMLISLADDKAIFYRMSGDEFFIQIKGDDNASVMNYLHAIQKGLQSITIDNEPITVSMGIAKYDQANVTDGNEMLRMTDLVMYIAKAKGKNTYHFLPVHEIKKLAR